MAIAIRYQISVANPSTVGGTSGSLQYFSSNPPQNLWNVGATGVNTPQQSSQLGMVPSSSSSVGMLPFDASGFKLQGGRFRLYASGVASCTTGTPTVTPIVQIVTPNASTGSIYVSPVYSTFLDGNASGALTANKPLAFTMAGDLYFDPSSGTLSGIQSWIHTAAASGSGGSNSGAPWAALTAVTGLSASSPSGTVGYDGSQPGFGFVAGVTFSAGSTGNSASLYEFAIIQD